MRVQMLHRPELTLLYVKDICIILHEVIYLGKFDSSFPFNFQSSSLTEKANSLPPEERKKYAEKVVVSFWKAIGGDEDEIDGLSDDD